MKTPSAFQVCEDCDFRRINSYSSQRLEIKMGQKDSGKDGRQTSDDCFMLTGFSAMDVLSVINKSVPYTSCSVKKSSSTLVIFWP